jgi:hypothetical protein
VNRGRPAGCEQSTVNLIVGLRLDGAKLITIAARLEARGIPTPSRTGRWTAQKVGHQVEPARAQGHPAFAAEARGAVDEACDELLVGAAATGPAATG